jgi:hypothetical protein
MRTLLVYVAFILLLGSPGIAQEFSPYIRIGTSTADIEEVSGLITTALKDNSFTILGDYHPANRKDLKVIAFTRDDLKNTVVKIEDRGALAAVFKIGLVKQGEQVVMSYTNPDYILRAYLRDSYGRYTAVFNSFASDLKKALAGVGNEFKPFGGQVEADELKKYHYKIMMPYFTDPVELNEFSSFDKGLSTIEANLRAGKGKTKMVYKLVYPDKQVAVFGVGLESVEDGEAHFLPKIGEAHAAALPYEIILQGKEATMLHGKYRIALHWPELTMGTFMKIMSTPGDIEDTLEAVCQ